MIDVDLAIAFCGGIIACCLVFAFLVWLFDRHFGTVGKDD